MRALDFGRIEYRHDRARDNVVVVAKLNLLAGVGATVLGVTVTAEVPCIHPSGSFGELAAEMTGLLAQKKSDATPFSLEDDTEPEFYVSGNLGSDPSTIRNFGSDVPGLTGVRPYSGNASEDITNYLADSTEVAIRHMESADQPKTPTFWKVRKARLLRRDTQPVPHQGDRKQ